MACEDEVYRAPQINYCLMAVAITFVIFGILYAMEQIGPVAVFAASISLTGIPFWLIVKRQKQFCSGVAPLWAIHAVVNLISFIIVCISPASLGWFLFVVFLGFGLIIFHIGLLVRATIIMRQKRELVDQFTLASLYLCALLLAIGIIFFDV